MQSHQPPDRRLRDAAARGSRPSLPAGRWEPPRGKAVSSSHHGRPLAAAGQSTGAAGGGGKGKVHHRQQRSATRKVVTPDGPSAPSSSSSASASAEHGAADFPRLDPTDPVQAKRMHQRRRQVLFGKNTAGYEAYAKQVPRHRRRIRSPDCPTTPDHTLDIPAKRWRGLMNAWRRGLHKYDPPELHLSQPTQDKITLAPRPCATEEDRQREEIAMAKASGLQVSFGSMNVSGREAGLFSMDVLGGEEGGAASSKEIGKSEEAAFEEEAAYRRANEDVDVGEGFLEGCDGEDSDDDIL